MKDTIAKAVEIFRRSPDLDEGAIFELLVASGLGRQVSARLVEFLPMAYVRVLLEQSGARFPDRFVRRLANGDREERQLNSEPVWNHALEFAKSEANGVVSREEFLSLARRGAEYQAANELLKGGSKLSDIGFTPSLLLWPDNGPAA